MKSGKAILRDWRTDEGMLTLSVDIRKRCLRAHLSGCCVRWELTSPESGLRIGLCLGLTLRLGRSAYKWHPGGPTDPNVVLINLVADRIELWSSMHGVTPDPTRGLWAAAVSRERDGWRPHLTLPLR